MLVETAAKSTLILLLDMLDKINNSQYSTHCKELNGASVGQHCRHIVEMFECLIQGYSTGTVNYDTRKRNQELELDKNAVSACINQLKSQISLPEKALRMATCYSQSTETVEYFSTTYHRELAYTLEHAVHHMAILKIGLRFIAPELTLPGNFGVAASTIRHKSAGAK